VKQESFPEKVLLLVKSALLEAFRHFKVNRHVPYVLLEASLSHLVQFRVLHALLDVSAPTLALWNVVHVHLAPFNLVQVKLHAVFVLLEALLFLNHLLNVVNAAKVLSPFRIPVLVLHAQ
jgi:hypothetical protein